MSACPHAETQYFGDGVYRCAECGDMVDLPKITFARREDAAEAEIRHAKECIDAGCIWLQHAQELSNDVTRLSAALSTAEREREALEILAATLLCELGRAEDPRLGGDTITVYDLAKRPTQTTPFKASFPRALTAAEARAILARVPSGGEEGRSR